MTIKHLVLSGGGPAGLLTYGAAKHLSIHKFWNIDNIESIYGTSIGSFMGVVLSLGYDWDWLDDYFIKRPWNKLIDLTPLSFIEVYNSRGLLDINFIIDTLKPLFTAKNLSSQVTMQQLYEYNNIAIHIYTTEINDFTLQKECITYKTHPSLPVVSALARSMAYPFVFAPVCVDGKCYIDGGLLNNYPLRDCIENTKCDENEILSFRNIWLDEEYKVSDDSNIFEFFMVILKKMKREIDMQNKQGEINNTVKCVVEDLNGLSSWLNALSTEELRKNLIDKGDNQGKMFLVDMEDKKDKSNGSVEKL